MVPGFWLTEGGQTASGSLVDHVILSHTRASGLEEKSKSTRRTVYQILNDRLDALARERDVPFRAALTRDLHVQPDFHGNRSPRADATLRGMVSGLSLSQTVDDVALLYYATIQALAHGIRHIIAEENGRGYGIDTIFACGGGSKNPVFLQEHADATGCRIVLPEEPEAVLLGSAILGATACGDFASVPEAMATMDRVAEVIEPAGDDVRKYHDAKYRVYHRMYEDQLAYRELMQDAVKG
jgi:ribulose kinase